MEMSTKENGSITKEKDLENLHLKMEMFIKENGNRTLEMEKEK